MKKSRVLFLCVHNSARSQMAAAFLRDVACDRFEVESAGLEPGVLNPIVVEAMRLAGIDISNEKPKSVFDLFRAGQLFSHVITVCDQASAERCPVFPGVTKRIQWSFADPSGFQGSPEERLQKTIQVRDQIRRQVTLWAANPSADLDGSGTAGIGQKTR
jgi:arsenate reductase (thioredoxin)